MKRSILILTVFLCAADATAQVRQRRESVNRLAPSIPPLSEAQRQEATDLFGRVRSAFEAQKAGVLSSHLHGAVHLSLPGAEQGQYSGGQATQLLQSFLASATSVRVTQERIEERAVSPYYAAQVMIDRAGSTDTLNLYISLHRTGDRWSIAHLTVY